MAVNLFTNVRDALDGLPVHNTHCWLDSSVALYWIRGQGEYKQFVSNCVQKINSHQGEMWRHVPTADNAASLRSHRGQMKGADLWWHGPEWLATTKPWPADILNEHSDMGQAETKLVRDVLVVAVNEENEIKDVLQKFSMQKAVRVHAWIQRFAHNSLRS